MRPRPLAPPKQKRRLPLRRLLVSFVAIVFIGGYSAVTITRPYNELSPSITNNTLRITTPASNLPWPAYAQGAFGLTDGSVIGTKGKQQPMSIASAAKIITALVVLERHPITANGNGPSITMTAADVALYNKYVAIGGSVTPVNVGQVLTQRQMLEAILLPSANNIADSLAIWSYGSVDAYLAAANQYLAKHDLTQTKAAGDASGYLPDSTSTASDLVKLGALAMRHPVVAQIVGQQTAVIPGVGTVRNYNSLLGQNGIVGIKTGNNDQNGGVFVGATAVDVNGKKVTLISALGYAPSLNVVLRDSNTLLAALRTTIADTTIVKKNTVLGIYTQSNGQKVQAVAASDLSTTVLRGSTVKAKVVLNDIGYSTVKGQTVGHVTIDANDLTPARSITVILKQSPTKPDIAYRLLHP